MKTRPRALIAMALLLLISVSACQREQPKPKPRPGFDDLGPIADNYAAKNQPSEWDHNDLNGAWITVTGGHAVKVTIDFERGVYSSDVPGTEEVRLRLVREQGLEVVFELEPYDGSFREEINCVFRDEDHISMIGHREVPQEFTRVK